MDSRTGSGAPYFVASRLAFALHRVANSGWRRVGSFCAAAELIAASRGLGFLLIDSQNTGRSDIIVLSIVLLALIGKFSDWLLGLLEKRLLRWQDAFGGR